MGSPRLRDSIRLSLKADSSRREATGRITQPLSRTLGERFIKTIFWKYEIKRDGKTNEKTSVDALDKIRESQSLYDAGDESG